MAIKVTTLDPHFTHKNTIDGIELSWDDVSSEIPNFLRYRLMRKRYDYSNTTRDGVILIDGPETFIKDTEAENGFSYYYTIFIVVDEIASNGEHYENFLTNYTFKKNVTIHKMNKSGQVIYNDMPQLYRTEDQKIESDIMLPLLRYLSLMGYQFDKIDNLIELVLDNIDIETCDERFLPILAKFLGVDYDWSLTVSDNRTLIKTMIANYNRKGTRDGLVFLLQTISNTNCDVTVDKTLTPVTASLEDIKKRRTVTTIIYLEHGNENWVGQRQEKVLDIVRLNIPKKNAFSIVVVLAYEYDEYYEKQRLKIEYFNDILGTHTIEYYDKDKVLLNDDDFFDTLVFKPDVEYYEKSPLLDPDTSGMRGISKRGYNMRGIISTLWDDIYKNNVHVDRVYWY